MTTPRADLPRLTAKQREIGDWQRTVEQFNAMSVRKTNDFITAWLDAFGEEIRKAACDKCIPPWLLAAVLLAEVLGMNEYLGSTERELELKGMGSSVGLGQITVDTAIKYGLTPGAKNFKQKADGIQQDLEPILEGEEYDVGISIMRIIIRRELLNPINNIRASACYLKNLIDQAISIGVISGYSIDSKSPWGTFNYGRIRPQDCPINLIDVTNARGCFRIEKLVGFFAAAHNDDALSGFREGIGLTQGQNAKTIGLILCVDGFIGKYKLDNCNKIIRVPSDAPEEHWNAFEWNELTNEEKKLWRKLGWAEGSWSADNSSDYPESYSTHWRELTPVQRRAATALGYDQATWDAGF